MRFSILRKWCSHSRPYQSEVNSSSMLRDLTHLVQNIQSLAQKCLLSRKQQPPMNSRKSSKALRYYDSHQNTIASSYFTHASISITSSAKLVEELRDSCARITSEHLNIATKNHLLNLVGALPDISLWWSRNSPEHQYSTRICDTLLQDSLSVIYRDRSNESLMRELPFPVCASLLAYSTAGLRYNETLYHLSDLTRNRVNTGSAFLTYFMLCPDTLYCYLIQEREVFMDIHMTVLQKSMSEMKSYENDLKSLKLGNRSSNPKATAKKYKSLHPKIFTTNLELFLDGLFLLDRRATAVIDVSYSRTLHAFSRQIFSKESQVPFLLTIYPYRYLCRLIRVFLYFQSRRDAEIIIPFVEEIIQISQAAIRGIEASSLLPLLRSVRYFEASLVCRSESFVEKLRTNVFVLLISLGEEAGRRVEEISIDHRQGIISIFQSLKNTNTITSCSGLERVLSSLTQW